MRCPDCNKFVGQEIQDPEVELELSDDRTDEDSTVTVSGTVRVVLACADCGTELKETTFDVDEQVEVEGHKGDDHELEVVEHDSEGTERQDGKPGTPSRYRKTFYGANVNFEVRCSCNGEVVVDGNWNDDCQASSFDEMV